MFEDGVNKLSSERFIDIRNTLLASFNKHGLNYKLFGGVVMNVYDDTRGTSDLDMAIQRTMDEVHKFVDALVDCDYGTRDEILEGIFGADPQSEEFLFAFCRIQSDNPYFSGFHIDLCFDFGSTSYESITTERQEIGGITVDMATLTQMLKMKQQINPPRDRDTQDIKFLQQKLGVSGSGIDGACNG